MNDRPDVENGWELWELDFGGGTKEWIAVTADVGVTAEEVREAYRVETEGDAEYIADADVSRVPDIDALMFVDTEAPEDNDRRYSARKSLAERGRAIPPHGVKFNYDMVATTEW